MNQFKTYPVENEWVIADDSGWLPGTFPSPQAAIAAYTQNND